MLTHAWVLLILAAAAESAYGIAVYHSRGFTLLWPSLGAVVAGITTSILLGWSMKDLPVGLAFAAWSGLAALGTVAYGILALGESASLVRLALIGLVLAGIVGLKLTSTH